MKECMKTSKVDAITVKQLAEKCGLTRQTFYRNFLDKFDLINWYFGKILNQSFEHMGRGTSVYDALVRKFTYIEQEKQFFAAAFQTVLWNIRQTVLGKKMAAPEGLAELMVEAMPVKLKELFEKLDMVR